MAPGVARRVYVLAEKPETAVNNTARALVHILQRAGPASQKED